MYDVILDATLRVLTDQGFDRTTTTRIAEIAGISVGSFYQYFANRDAALIALIERHRQRFNDLILQALESEKDHGLDKSLEMIADTISQSFAVCARLPESLKTQISPSFDISEESARAERNRTLLVQMLLRHSSELRSGISVAGAAFVIASLIEGVLCLSLRLRMQSTDSSEAGSEYLALLRGFLLAAPK